MNPRQTGLVIAAFKRQYLVSLPDGRRITCLTRGKNSVALCGDRVEIQCTGESAKDGSDAQGIIERILPRHSLLHRSDAFREKFIAANVTQIIIVVAAEPPFSDELLARCLIAACEQQLATLIVLNKCDLAARADSARAILKPYRDIGCRILELSAKQDVSPLRRYLDGQHSILVGQSGMGKSTLINALLPDVRAATREISSALNSGKHTTTHAKLYPLDDRSSLIDCPGVQAFGLHHLSIGEIEQGFSEFSPYLGQCRFRDCHHLHEPGCALQAAVASGAINARRLELFHKISAHKA
ncbi:MAG: ribosome small subunit-dependent GTPase A [Pseudomonadota bacterium]